MKKGFTLIELLVVIAIIGILASVVLVSFPGATKKAKDSRIISAISQARTVMTYINANDGNYDNFSCDYSDMKALCDEVTNQDQTLTTHHCSTCSSEGGPAACMYSGLNVGGYYCSDSTGVAGVVDGTVDPGAAGYCDGTTAVCPPLK